MMVLTKIMMLAKNIVYLIHWPQPSISLPAPILLQQTISSFQTKVDVIFIDLCHFLQAIDIKKIDITEITPVRRIGLITPNL